jgi:transcription elongation GreA/GreB family factor
MSRAFVREGEGAAAVLPERTVSPHPNLVTERGLAEIEARVRELETARSALREGARASGATPDAEALAAIERDLRYWSQRRASARVIVPAPDPQAVRFGVAVTLRASNGAERTLRLVGEDEADPARGLLSWVSPLGRSLIALALGDTVEFDGDTLEIVALSC